MNFFSASKFKKRPLSPKEPLTPKKIQVKEKITPDLIQSKMNPAKTLLNHVNTTPKSM